MKNIVIMGLGYVGLPLAVQAAKKGYTVTGIDLNTDLIDKINRRESPFATDERFSKAFTRVPRHMLTATNDLSALDTAEAIIICVPTPTENNIPDLRPIVAASKQIGAHLHRGQLVCLESTVNAGVTRDVIMPILEAASGLTCGKDFCLTHCPERIDPGNPKYYVGNLNRVVGGITDDCTARAVAFYSSIIDAEIVQLGSTEEAEFVKSWENTQRNVMIAMANNAAIICDAMHMDVTRVQKGLQSKVDQFGLKLAAPGIGPGGHCIPEDIHYVIKRARESGIDTRFLDDAAELNDRMPSYAVHKFSDVISAAGRKIQNLKVGLLGLTYKPDVADMRKTPAIEVAYLLSRYAKEVIVHDPYMDSLDTSRLMFPRKENIADVLDEVDAVFVATAHKQYVHDLDGTLLSKYHVNFVLDGRNCLRSADIEQHGITYAGIGS